MCDAPPYSWYQVGDGVLSTGWYRYAMYGRFLYYYNFFFLTVSQFARFHLYCTRTLKEQKTADFVCLTTAVKRWQIKSLKKFYNCV